MLQLEGVEYAYPNGVRLRFANLQAIAGRVLWMHGPSGSGKSTLLALMAGLLVPSAGRVAIDGLEPARLPAARRDAWRAENLGFMPQRLHLSTALTVADNLALPSWCTGRPAVSGRLAALVQALQLGGLEHRYPHQLSVGQAQRVALARALWMQPKWVLADEPTANLDDEACALTLALLLQHTTAAGATLVIASHDRRVPDSLPGLQRYLCAAAAP
jgi:putative ABC transport system ATP-binding protein